MDITTAIGLIAGAIVIATLILLGGDFRMFYDVHAIIIIFGGSIAATMATSFFVSRRSLKPSAQSGMPQWQDHLFIAMNRSANDATDYFQIPTGRVVEVGTQVTI